MSDVAERMRHHVGIRGGPAKDDDGNYIGTTWPMMLEAADEIERLHERCDAYKGQVKCGSEEISRLRLQLADAEATLFKLNSGEELQSLMKLNNELRSQLDSVRKVIDAECEQKSKLVAEKNDLQGKVIRKTTILNRYRTALVSIAANTCCNRCQEAALVAQAALTDDKEKS